MTKVSPQGELNLEAWVDRAGPAQRAFREAVHLVLLAIGASTFLRDTMVMKGGMLMATRYNSERFTKDADFSTREKYSKGVENKLLIELTEQLVLASDRLSYDTICRIQNSEIRPARADASYQSLKVKIGYARRSKSREFERLLSGQAITVVEIDFCYNEAVFDIEIIELGDGDVLHAYSFLNLLAEKFRSLLQQPVRDRNRRQDVYDLHLLLSESPELESDELVRLLELLIASCRKRDIEPAIDSLGDPTVQAMAQKGYSELAPEIEGALPPFATAYQLIRNLYERLPWPRVT